MVDNRATNHLVKHPCLKGAVTQKRLYTLAKHIVLICIPYQGRILYLIGHKQDTSLTYGDSLLRNYRFYFYTLEFPFVTIYCTLDIIWFGQ